MIAILPILMPVIIVIALILSIISLPVSQKGAVSKQGYLKKENKGHFKLGFRFKK